MRVAIARERSRLRLVVIVLANTFFAFVILNAVIWCWYALSDAFHPLSNNIEKAYGVKLDPYYPGLAKSQIDQLMSETYQPVEYEPFVEFRERPRAGKYVNVDRAGFRLSSAQSKWPPDPSRPVVFVFGGSTTFGYGVPDDETVVSALAAMLRRDPRFRDAQVYNFARAFYWSTQEYILLSTMMLSGPKPDMAIFIDGLNEFYYAKQRPVFADDMHQSFERETALRQSAKGKLSALWRDVQQLWSSLPLFRLTAAARGGRPAPGQALTFLPYDPESVRSAIANYFINKAMIKRIAELNHIETWFAWQPIPSYRYPRHLHGEFEASGYGPHSQSFYGYPQMKEAIEQRKDDDFIWCADVHKDATSSLYVDLVHYNRRGAELLAECIAGAVLARPTGPHAAR